MALRVYKIGPNTHARTYVRRILFLAALHISPPCQLGEIGRPGPSVTQCRPLEAAAATAASARALRASPTVGDKNNRARDPAVLKTHNRFVRSPVFVSSMFRARIYLIDAPITWRRRRWNPSDTRT